MRNVIICLVVVAALFYPWIARAEEDGNGYTTIYGTHYTTCIPEVYRVDDQPGTWAHIYMRVEIGDHCEDIPTPYAHTFDLHLGRRVLILRHTTVDRPDLTVGYILHIDVGHQVFLPIVHK